MSLKCLAIYLQAQSLAEQGDLKAKRAQSTSVRPHTLLDSVDCDALFRKTFTSYSLLSTAYSLGAGVSGL